MGLTLTTLTLGALWLFAISEVIAASICWTQGPFLSTPSLNQVGSVKKPGWRRGMWYENCPVNKAWLRGCLESWALSLQSCDPEHPPSQLGPQCPCRQCKVMPPFPTLLPPLTLGSSSCDAVSRPLSTQQRSDSFPEFKFVVPEDPQIIFRKTVDHSSIIIPHSISQTWEEDRERLGGGSHPSATPKPHTTISRGGKVTVGMTYTQSVGKSPRCLVLSLMPLAQPEFMTCSPVSWSRMMRSPLAKLRKPDSSPAGRQR